MPKNKTPKELEAENDKLLADLDKEPETPTEDKQPDSEPEKEPDNNPDDKKDDDKEPETPTEDKQPDSEPEKEPEPSPDYKEKFSASSREAQKVVAKNRKINQAIDEANEIPEPTTEELKLEYPDYDLLDETTKKIARDTYVSNKRFSLISKARTEGKKIEKWSEDVDKFVDDPKSLIDFPELEGKVEEFKDFANQESNNSIPFKVLVTSFLYERSKKESVKRKGDMFPSGSGGPNEKPQKKSDKISVAESEILRKTNYNEYKRLLTEGKIDNTKI